MIKFFPLLQVTGKVVDLQTWLKWFHLKVKHKFPYVVWWPTQLLVSYCIMKMSFICLTKTSVVLYFLSCWLEWRPWRCHFGVIVPAIFVIFCGRSFIYLLLIPLQKESEQKDLFSLNGSIKHGVVTMVDAEKPFFLARLPVFENGHFGVS